MSSCQERSSSSSAHVPQHHRLEDSMRSWVDFDSEDFTGPPCDRTVDMDASVTSSILSQSFAGSVRQGYAHHGGDKRASADGSVRSMASSLSSMNSSVAGGSARFGSSGILSNPNSGGGAVARRSSLEGVARRSSLEFARRSSLEGGVGRRSSLGSHAPRQRLRKGVRFHPKVQCQTAVPRSSYTPREKDATWYSSDAGKEMQRDILLTVQAMRTLHGRRVPADRVDLELTAFFGEERTDRGLEHMRTARSIENRRRHKASVSAAVLDEQALQWEGGLEPGSLEGEMRIAEASMVTSKVARDDAARKGRKDARFVQALREEERGEMDMSLNGSFSALANGSLSALAAHHAAAAATAAGLRDLKGELRSDGHKSMGWTAFEDSSNAFAELTLEDDGDTNPNEADESLGFEGKSTAQSGTRRASRNSRARPCSPRPSSPSEKNNGRTAKSGAATTVVPKLQREGASRSAQALRRVRLSQLAGLANEEIPGGGRNGRRGGPTGSPASSDAPGGRNGRRGSLTTGSTVPSSDSPMPRQPAPTARGMPRRNSLRAQGA